MRLINISELSVISLQELNKHLVDKVFFVDNKLTLADILLYLGLYIVFVSIFLLECVHCIKINKLQYHMPFVSDNLTNNIVNVIPNLCFILSESADVLWEAKIPQCIKMVWPCKYYLSLNWQPLFLFWFLNYLFFVSTSLLFFPISLQCPFRCFSHFY